MHPLALDIRVQSFDVRRFSFEPAVYKNGRFYWECQRFFINSLMCSILPFGEMNSDFNLAESLFGMYGSC